MFLYLFSSLRPIRNIASIPISYFILFNLYFFSLSLSISLSLSLSYSLVLFSSPFILIFSGWLISCIHTIIHTKASNKSAYLYISFIPSLVLWSFYTRNTKCKRKFNGKTINLWYNSILSEDCINFCGLTCAFSFFIHK